jgi:hypothetical protein
MTYKFLLAGAVSVLAIGAANAATVATEGFVRSAVDYAVGESNDYTDTVVGNLATVATSGSYNDLTDLPAMPTAIKPNWDAPLGDAAEILNRPTLGTAAGADIGDFDAAGSAAAALSNANTYTDSQLQTGLANKQDVIPATAADSGKVLKIDSTGALVLGTDNEGTTTDISGKANLESTVGADQAGYIATVDAAGQYVRGPMKLENLVTQGAFHSGLGLKADTTFTGSGPLDTNSQNLGAAVNELSGNISATQDALVGPAGQVLVGTDTGYTWMATTGETFTPLP